MKESISYKPVVPKTTGWLEYKLDNQQLDYLWRCIKNKKQDVRNTLAGNITSSRALMDHGNWFFNEVLNPLIDVHIKEFKNLEKSIPGNNFFKLSTWWVNYQRQNEFQPVHNHSGLYSFVIFMKIPIDSREQNKKRKSKNPRVSNFEFLFTDTLGNISSFPYRLTPADEGTMLFFPAPLDHQVYPFYDCDEERITVSGNITYDLSRMRN